jgi:hypothetical protein
VPRFLRRLGPEPTPQVPAYSFCEPVWATPTSKEHIRAVDEHGLKPGGGIDTDTLCGSDVRRGWDLPTPVTPERVRSLASPLPGDGRIFLCRTCADLYLDAENVPGLDAATGP